MKRILIAEDSSEWQRYHASLLKTYDKVPLDFFIAPNARTAFEEAEKNLNPPFDLIMSDLQMETDFLPEFAGEWFVKQVKNMPEYKNIPIVLVSATYNIGFIAHNLGIDYFSKRTLVNHPDSYFSILDDKLLKT